MRTAPWFQAEGRNFGESIALMHCELSEALDEWRKGSPVNEVYYDEVTTKVSATTPGHTDKPEGVPIEFADLILRVLLECAREGIDIDEAIRLKMYYNNGRQWKDGQHLRVNPDAT